MKRSLTIDRETSSMRTRRSGAAASMRVRATRSPDLSASNVIAWTYTLAWAAEISCKNWDENSSESTRSRKLIDLFSALAENHLQEMGEEDRDGDTEKHSREAPDDENLERDAADSRGDGHHVKRGNSQRGAGEHEQPHAMLPLGHLHLDGQGRFSGFSD